jgi:hypothetical protein
VSRLYTSLNKEEEFRQYIDIIKLANKRKPALLANITLETGQVEDLVREASYIKNRKTQDTDPFKGILRAAYSYSKIKIAHRHFFHFTTITEQCA